MFVKCRYSIIILAAGLPIACGGRGSGRTAPFDPFTAVEVAPLPIASLGGSSALLMGLGALVVGDSVNPLVELMPRRLALLQAANAALDTALRQGAPEVRWFGLVEQRQAARRAPTLGLDPDHVPTAYLAGPRVEQVPEPLASTLRSLAALSGARIAVVPAAARLSGRPGAYTATFVFAAVDARLNMVIWRGRTAGAPAETPEAALAGAARVAIPASLPSGREDR
jgi:hypothetical protein